MWRYKSLRIQHGAIVIIALVTEGSLNYLYQGQEDHKET